MRHFRRDPIIRSCDCFLSSLGDELEESRRLIVYVVRRDAAVGHTKWMPAMFTGTEAADQGIPTAWAPVAARTSRLPYRNDAKAHLTVAAINGY
jgi:hypothetical protein